MEKQVIKMEREKETKNTYRYQEQIKGKPPILNTLYIQKWLEPAQTISVTIEDVK